MKNASNKLKKRPQAIFFDWDDTVMSTDWLCVKATEEIIMRNRAIFAKVHGNIPDNKIEIYAANLLHEHVGIPLDIFNSKIFGDNNSKELVQEYRDIYRELRIKHGITLMPKAEEVFKKFQDINIPICIVSNKRQAMLESEIIEVGFGKYLTAIVGAADGFFKPNPEPAMLAKEKMEKRLGIKIDFTKTWFVGDSVNDVLCAQACGCLPIFVGNIPHLPAQSQQDIIAEKIVVCKGISDLLHKDCASLN